MKNLNKHAVSVLLLSGLLPVAALAQISFTNASSKFTNSNFTSGNAISVADMDGDGLDDIARMDDGYIMSVERQRPGQQFQKINGTNMGSGSAWAMVVGDANSNGFKDVVAGFNGSAKLAIDNGAGTGYGASNTLINSSYFLQNMNMMDVDNDGDLDIFGCNDVGQSKIWVNNGTGTYTVSNIINFNVTPDVPGDQSTDDSGNYGSIWSDFDNDGDIDLYIAKCRQGVGNSNDPRRINLLFVNNGNGTFTENAQAHNLRIGAQSWTANFEDVNNDGWFDVLITNHDEETMLMLNNGSGGFTDINLSNGAGLNIGFTPYESKMADFDNDGFVDVLITGSANNPSLARLFRNNGNNTFSPVTTAFPSNNTIQSFGIGDLNHDGKLDIYAGYANGYNSPSSTNDILWLNSTENDNHFVSYDLQGVISNRDAVGARIFLYGAWGIQTREVRAGESYGTSNSFHLHFGLGAATTVDSAIIRWPSGTVTKLTNQPADQFYHVVEGDCVSPLNEITYIGSPYLCPGQSVTLSAPSGAGYSYLWSNGATTQTIQASATGEFSVQVTSGNCSSWAPLVSIELSPNQTPVLNVVGDTKFCEGGSVTLEGPAGMSAYNWSNGATTQNAVITQSGTYTLTIQGYCEQFTSAPVSVEVLASPAPVTTGASVMNSGSGTLGATGNNIEWFSGPSGGTAIGTGASFTTPVLSSTTTYYAQSTYHYPGDTSYTGQTAHSGSSQYSGSNNTNTITYFDVFANCTLLSAKVYTDTPGNRLVQIKQGGTVISSVLVNIPSTAGMPDGIRVALNLPLTPGSYTIETDAATNTTNFGYTGPRLQRSNGGGVAYPYPLTGLVSITGCSEGAGLYYYFYDWEVEEEGFYCVSERTPATLTVLSDVGLNEAADAGISVYPNPASGLLNIKTSEGFQDAVLKMIDVSGKVVLLQQNLHTAAAGTATVDVSAFAPGMYTLQVIRGDSRINRRIIVR